MHASNTSYYWMLIRNIKYCYVQVSARLFHIFERLIFVRTTRYHHKSDKTGGKGHSSTIPKRMWLLVDWKMYGDFPTTRPHSPRASRMETPQKMAFCGTSSVFHSRYITQRQHLRQYHLSVLDVHYLICNLNHGWTFI